VTHEPDAIQLYLLDGFRRNLAERGILICVLKLKYLEARIVDFFTLVKPEMSILSSLTSDFMAGMIRMIRTTQGPGGALTSCFVVTRFGSC
jgi:hypothetical protein